MYIIEAPTIENTWAPVYARHELQANKLNAFLYAEAALRDYPRVRIRRYVVDPDTDALYLDRGQP